MMLGYAIFWERGEKLEMPSVFPEVRKGWNKGNPKYQKMFLTCSILYHQARRLGSALSCAHMLRADSALETKWELPVSGLVRSKWQYEPCSLFNEIPSSLKLITFLPTSTHCMWHSIKRSSVRSRIAGPDCLFSDILSTPSNSTANRGTQRDNGRDDPIDGSELGHFFLSMCCFQDI